MSETESSSSGNVQTVSFDTLLDNMYDILTRENLLKRTHAFFNKSDDYEKVIVCYELLKKHMLPTIIKVEKNDAESEERRKYANRLFALSRDEEALKHYNQSIAFAETDEVRSLSYANRSAIYYRKGLHKECLTDIQNAKDNKYPDDLIDKILIREAKSLEFIESDNYVKHEPYFGPIPKISGNPNTKVECASDSVDILTDDINGRHVVAARDIEPGEVLAVEDSYTTILLRSNYLTHCYHCLRPSYNLIPCLECTLAMFCGQSCRDMAWDQYHKYECPILNTLHDIKATKLHFIAVRVVLCAREQYYKLIRGEKTTEAKILRAADYEGIHNLCTNEHLRNFNDKLYRALLAATIFYLLEETLLKDYSDSSDLESIQTCVLSLLYKHLMTVPTNMHSITEFQGSSKIDYNCVEIGCGAYSFMSILNHSCSCFVTRTYYGTKMVLHALRPIKAGEQIYDNYGFHHALMERSKRRETLKQRYYFDCQCDACAVDLPLYSEINNSMAKDTVSAEEMLTLGRCDRSMEVDVLPRLIKNAKRLEECKQKKLLSLLDNQEIMKQLLGSLGNKNTLI